MSGTDPSRATVQVYRIYIRAAPQAVWEAITKPEWTERYGYRMEYDLRPGGDFRGYTSEAQKRGGAAIGIRFADVAVEGEVIEVVAPRKLVLRYHMVIDEVTAAEGFTHLTYEIEAAPGGVTKLTLTHDLDGAPTLSALVSGAWEDKGAGGGWSWVLSEIKSLLETGKGMVR